MVAPEIAWRIIGFVALHVIQSNAADEILESYRSKIIAEIDGTALRVGRLLREARDRCPQDFGRWVESDLPFGHETARRLIAISAAYEKLSPDTLRGLPRPWQAMYALKEIPAGNLAAAVEYGELTPDTTVEQAKTYARTWRGDNTTSMYRKADLVAGRLLRMQPSDLSTPILASLRQWLEAG